MCQAYVALRFLLCQQRRPLSRYQKWLFIARLLDALERDYRDVYADDEARPFAEGFERDLSRLLTNSLDHGVGSP